MQINARQTRVDERAISALIPIERESTGALRERLRSMEAVVENFPGGIALFDKSMQMVLCNARLKQMLEYPETLFSGGYPTMKELFTFNASRGEYGPGDPKEQVERRLALLAERAAHVYERTRPDGRVLEVRGVPLAGGVSLPPISTSPTSVARKRSSPTWPIMTGSPTCPIALC